MKRLLLLVPVLIFAALAPLARAVNLTAAYFENFDSMGTAGTAPPSGWSVKIANSGSLNTSWTTTIPANGADSVASMIATTNVLTVSNSPTTTTSVAFNAQGASSSDRVLSTSPTSVAGNALELSLTNTSGAAISALQVRYDTRRYTAAASANELPGYWLFYSLDNGTTWTNVSALNPTIATIPNTAGVFTQTWATFTLSSQWTNGATLLLRWVDDNAQQTSPDQIVGLDNVGVTTTPANAAQTALLFNGVNQYVTMGAATSTLGTSSLTIECWFKRTGTGVTTSTGTGGVTSAIPLVTKGRGEADGSNVDCNYFLGIDSTTGKIVADFEAQAGVSGITPGQNYPITGNTVIANNTWYHVAATYDTSTYTWKLYVNGTLDATFSNPAGAVPRNDSIQHFGIGTALTSTGAAAGFFQGIIDEARVWNVARTAAQVAASKDYEISAAIPGLLARYGLNEGTGTSANNAIGVGGAPVGTVTNSPAWVGGASFLTNALPAVTLSAPGDGTIVAAGLPVTLTADASDSDGSILKVEFYQGVTKIGEALAAPYSLSWTPPSAGAYALSARVIDNNSGTTNSNTANIQVNANAAPTVALTTPPDNTTVTAPASVTLTATATDSDGTIAKVEFFNGATKLGEALNAPYSYSWTGVTTGDYTLTAVATDSLGSSTTSAAVTLHVSPPATTPPTVSLIAPADGASFVAPANITLSATANDADGSATKVEFFNGATKLGEATTAPYTYAWNNIPVGDYAVTAKATDDQTATTSSAAITVHVTANQPPVVTLAAPADGATNIGSSTNLQLAIADPEASAQTVTFYGRRTTPAAAGADFTVIAVPDTQYYSENTARNPSSTGNSAIDTGAVAAIFHAQTQWIVDNRDTRNIHFVSHMGDIAQNGDAYESEWIVADSALARLENPATTLRAHGIPWGVAPGNHDQQPIGDASGTTNYYTKYFNFTRWDSRPYYGGHYGMKRALAGDPAPNYEANTNNYELFSASGLDFIVVHLEYDARAVTNYQSVLDWADALLKAYPDRRAIVTSHWVVNTGNPASFSTQGQAIYNALKNNPNFFLMLCGHVHGEGQRADTFAGRTVYSILSDYQEAKNGGNGFLRILTFKPASNVIHVESYSPTLNRAVNASDSVPSWTAAYDLPYNMQNAVTDWIPLGTVNVAAGETSANLAWTGLEAGKDYQWYATVNDGVNTVTTASRRFSTAAAVPPTVSLTTPSDGSSFGVSDPITLTVSASDSDGMVTKVEFFDGGKKLGETTTAPFTYVWTGASAGSHTITAVATDNSGLDAISAPITVSVNNALPTVALTEPDPEETFNSPASIYLSANAADSDGTIAKVEFLANGVVIATDTTAPFEYFWTTAITGDYAITARATDNSGGTATSSAITIHVINPDNVAPTVTLTSPANGGAFAAGSSIGLAVTTSDTDGVVSKVDYYQGSTLIGTSSVAPFAATWSNVPAGGYTIKAIATDNDGGVTESSPASITVSAAGTRALVGSVTENFDSMGTTGTAAPLGWTFYGYTAGTNATWTDSIPIPGSAVGGGTANATLIATTTFDTANTKSATQGYNFALAGSSTDRALGTSPTSTEGVALQLTLTNATGGPVTSISVAYDIRRFTAASAVNELPGYWLFYSLDNGSTWTNVSALNPTVSGPSGIVVPNTVGVTSVLGTTVTLSSAWANGTNLLLRWVDDNAVATSADQIVGLDNVAITLAAAPVGQLPSVAITSPTVSDTFVAPATISIVANATDSDGTIAKVEFFNGSTKVGEALSAPYTYSWMGVAAGTYSLTAKATDNDGNVVVSSAIPVTVNPAPGSGSLTRGPYLQKAAPAEITVRWRSSQSVLGRVQYGTSAGSLTSTVDESAATTDHVVTLTGLTPNTTYFYSIGSAYDTLAGDTTTTFTTSPSAGTAVNTRVWVLGDAGTGTSNQTAVRDAFYTWTGSRTPNFILQLGDNAYNSGLDSEFQTAVFNMYGTMLKKAPLWSCLGNHETNQATSFVDTYPYFSIYTFPTAGECGGVPSGTEHYYSFDYGNIHIISLDSMTASRSSTGAMANWLRNDLASTTATWIVCIFHHPPYTKGSHNSDTETELIEMRQNILPILEDGGVDLVLGGHSHAYERSYLIDSHYGLSTTFTNSMKVNGGDGRVSGNGAYLKPLTGPRDHFGAVYNVSGSAGQISGGTLNHPAHYISLNNLGSLVLDINGTRLDATFVRENGTTPDTYTIIKQGAADSDSDGIPDEYEIANGLDRHNATDANLDLDGDGLSNVQEYALGTAANVVNGIDSPIAMTSPFNGVTYTAPATLTLSTTASDAPANIARVVYFQSGTKIGESSTNPFTITAIAASPGIYTFSAIAVETNGSTRKSNTISVTVASRTNASPSVSLTAPVNGAALLLPGPFNLTATASDSDGVIAQVAFYADGQLIGQTAQAPYAMSWTTATPGTHTLTAVAIDNDGQVTASAPVNVTIGSEGGDDVPLPPWALAVIAILLLGIGARELARLQRRTQ